MTAIYIITSGEYSDYGINSVWSSKDKAEEICKLLNAGKMWNDFRVEEYPVDEPLERNVFHMVRGFKVVYDFSENGMDVDVANVVFSDALFAPSPEARVTLTSKAVIVLGTSKEKCLRILFDTIAQKKAEDEGLTS